MVAFGLQVKNLIWFYLIIYIMIYFVTSHMLVGDFERESMMGTLGR